MANNPSNIVPDNLIVIEGGKQLVPAPAPSDAGKVLGVVNASGDIGWVEDQGGTLTQVQADWAETDPSKVSFIDNKPTIPSKTSDLQNDSGFITSSDIPAIPTKTSELQNDSGFITSADVPAQVQANWNETSTGAASYIQNKPSIPSKTSDLQNDSGFITSSDIPAIPTKTSDLQNDSGFITSSDIPAQVQSDWNETNTSSAAYIQNKPTIPPGVTVDQTYNASSTNAQSGVAVAEAIATIPVAPTYSEGDGVDITNNVISADVDGVTIGIDPTTHKIKSLQTIPTKTSDLQNDSGFITSSDIPSIPTKTSDLQNDSGFITSSDIPAQVQANWNESNSSSAAYIQNKPSIPTVDQTYNASSTNAQSGVAVASAVAGVNAVPASTSADEDKVLTVNSSGVPVWAASSAPASKPLVQGNGITITDGQNDVTISANADQTYSASSTNAQSGVAVASAIAGIRQVPASTSADEDKVLTVNSSGTPVWAEAQGGGGSSGDSEFPYDPGFMHTDWGEMIVRFGDTSYDPTTKSSASHFTSITPMSEPGVYKYVLKYDYSTHYQLFMNEWNDYANNPVDILQLTSESSMQYREPFYSCMGLRSVWNIRGNLGNMENWFSNCGNLQIISSKLPEYFADGNIPGYAKSLSYCALKFGSAEYAFSNCPSLKRIECLLYSDVEGADISYLCSSDAALQVGPGLAQGGYQNLAGMFSSCTNMTRLYGLSDLSTVDASKLDKLYNPTVRASNSIDGSAMFSDCRKFTDFNGTQFTKFGNYQSLRSSFSGCYLIEEIPSFVLRSSGVDCYDMCYNCYGLKNVPDIDYSRITNAGEMFKNCLSLVDVNRLVDLKTACTDVSDLLAYAQFVSRGALDVYTALSGAGSAVTTYSSAFSDTGIYGWNDQRSQIPSSWGGTGA